MKKILILCVALIVSFTAIAGSIAYFTDTVSTDNNVIVAGNIDVEQHEQRRVYAEDGSYTLDTFEQNQNLYPCVTANMDKVDVVVGEYTVQMYDRYVTNFMDKIVTVQNAGTSPSYIRTFVAVPAAVNGYDWIHLDYSENGWSWAQPDALRSVEINGLSYDVYVATYADMLPAGATTSPSLLGVYMDGRVSNDGDKLVYVAPNGEKHDVGEYPSISILVTTEAAQTTTFADAYDALTQTFADVEGGHHPWKK